MTTQHTPGDDDGMYRFIKDLVATADEVIDRHEEAGAVVHRADPHLHMDLIASIAREPKGFFFELLVQARRALTKGDVEVAADRLKAAVDLANRHEEVAEMTGLVKGIATMQRLLTPETDTRMIVAIEQQLAGIEAEMKESMEG